MSDIDFTTASSEDLAAITAEEFMTIVKKLSDKDIARVMASPNRERIIGEIFDRMPGLYNADKAGGVKAVTQWRISGRADGGADEFTVTFADRTCSVQRGHHGDLSLGITMDPVSFVKIITKRGNPVMMFMTGKIKAKGDLGLAANIANFFDIPRG